MHEIHMRAISWRDSLALHIESLEYQWNKFTLIIHRNDVARDSSFTEIDKPNLW